MPRPKKTTRNLTDEQRAVRSENLRKAREAKAAQQAKAVPEPREEQVGPERNVLKTVPKESQPPTGDEKLGKKVLINGTYFRQVHVPFRIEADDQSFFKEQLGDEYDPDYRYCKVQNPPSSWGMGDYRARYIQKGYTVARTISDELCYMKVPRERWEKEQLAVFERDAERRQAKGKKTDEDWEETTVSKMDVDQFMAEEAAKI